MSRRDARILVNRESGIVAATDAALELLGLTLDELKGLPPGALSLDDDRATSADLEAAWQDSGRGEIAGSGTIRKLDGHLMRLRYLIAPLPDGGFEIMLEESGEAVTEPPRTYTVGTALSAWRAAERKLATIDATSSEWAAAQAEFDYFRTEYQRMARGRAERRE